MKYLITGVAGFIGSRVAKKLCSLGHRVIGIDNINDYYDVELKYARLKDINSDLLSFHKVDIANKEQLNAVFLEHDVDIVIHLAAQAGVRYSIDNPDVYGESNLVGHLNILECCRHNKIKHLVYASSSSVYGLNSQVPFSTNDGIDHPISLYAATKKANELMSHSYSHLYQLPTTGLRFFTVYGSWGRPDMAPLIFTTKISNGETINVNNNGEMWRDFTHIDDVVEGIIKVSKVVPKANPNWESSTDGGSTSSAPYVVYNLGNGNPINLMDFITAIEDELGKKAIMNFREMQPGDVLKTYADSEPLQLVTGFTPKVTLEEGVRELVTWYKQYQ
ncbi:protein CapI [Vibrio sp. 10N.286.49.C2]|uniref:NAD-dependent epimerase/dehydratase family protein n=1 Tax=unclassified Vibrio TaxID=2614977 RepID=UPI000C83E686|nr:MULTISPECIES: NAD-dependent epimerase/dehydratase family protein [unclassified Vibrio]PMH32819.1 protein CapI [Vibrio sp. 10N.286.49.C2]PMH57538.1 protein CapI [Vibrio sp. 10N.286.49.B1]PMH83990.1 protein CapI [Vibrio sp. 10N.286.48.B7]